ncbi:hypothetical protein [Photobacterium sanguinicancri]|uniref:hypothetical protein n=1 Tax=Photobacterium sanguinicancri TaxID=875932 RepID=UPI003D13927C
MIQAIYDGMWDKFITASERNEYELDKHLLDLDSDTRRGITALTYLKQGSGSALDEIVKFQTAVQEIEPNQYYHPFDELHLTVLSVISCIPAFELNEINTKSYADVFRSVLCSSLPPIEVKYQGVTASPNCIVVQGFPVNDALEKLRNNLRTQLTDAGLRVTFDSRYKLVTAHSSIVRFRLPISDGQTLLALCQQYRNHKFGRIVFTDFELVFNNWYQNLAVTESLAGHSQLLTHS